MTNLDLKKSLKHLYKPSAKAVSTVTVPPQNYLMIDGTGSPGTSQRYADAAPALYNLAYGIRAICKANGNQFTVMPLEGLWDFDGAPVEDFVLTDADKERFVWTLMILQPDFVTSDMVEQARAAAAKKKGVSPLLGEVRFETYDEGEAAQIMHIGPYTEEGPTVEKLHQHIAENGWSLGARHHEIYLSDPRKVEGSRLKTIIRQPFVRR